jgi:hypothetical protein
MKKMRFTEQQILGFLNEAEGRDPGQGAVSQARFQRHGFPLLAYQVRRIADQRGQAVA